MSDQHRDAQRSARWITTVVLALMMGWMASIVPFDTPAGVTPAFVTQYQAATISANEYLLIDLPGKAVYLLHGAGPRLDAVLIHRLDPAPERVDTLNVTRTPLGKLIASWSERHANGMTRIVLMQHGE